MDENPKDIVDILSKVKVGIAFRHMFGECSSVILNDVLRVGSIKKS